MASGKRPCQNLVQTLIKKPPHNGDLQSTAAGSFGIVPMSICTSVIGQAGSLLQINERTNEISFLFRKCIFLKNH